MSGKMWLIPWAVALLVTALVFGTVYSVAQQMGRTAADDAPSRLASQIAADLPMAETASAGVAHIDLSRSLAVFYVVYGSNGRPIFGSGYLHGSLAAPPVGVLEHTRRVGSNRVTWQPADGLRFATVELRAGDSVILAGQSLGLTETSADRLLLITFAGWAGSSILIMLGAATMFISHRRT
jgi:hypothetical protein